MRVKTGCLTCRRRRKGCGEEKPVCTACNRLQLPCIWPPTQAQPAADVSEKTQALDEQVQSKRATLIPKRTDLPLRNHTRSVPLVPKRLVPRPSHPPSDGYPKFRNDLEHSLFLQTSGILFMFICPIADQSCYQLSQFMCAALQEQWSRDAIVAFTASFRALAEPQLSLPAAAFYQSALTGLRDNLYDHGTVARRQMLLVATNSLGLIEVSLGRSFFFDTIKTDQSCPPRLSALAMRKRRSSTSRQLGST